MNKNISILLGLTIAIAIMLILADVIPSQGQFFGFSRFLNSSVSNYASIFLPYLGFLISIIFLFRNGKKSLLIALLIFSLFDIVYSNKSKIISSLNDKLNVDITLKTNKISAPLYRALENNNTVKILQLLKNGANSNGMVIKNRTNLDIAISKNNINAIKALIQYGANINYTSEFNETALSYATAINNYEIVKILLENGANPNIQNKPSKDTYPHKKINFGRTALFVAVERNYYDVAKLLLSHKASIAIKDRGDKTVFDFIKDERMKALLKKQAN